MLFVTEFKISGYHEFPGNVFECDKWFMLFIKHHSIFLLPQHKKGKEYLQLYYCLLNTYLLVTKQTKSPVQTKTKKTTLTLGRVI